MEWNVILDYILKIAGSTAAALIMALASVLFAKLQSKIKESKIVTYVKEVVKAAEQLYPNMGTKTGTQKYEYVVEQVLAKFPALTDNEYLKSLIEGAVFSLSEEIKQIAAEKAKEIKVEAVKKEESSNTLSIS